MHAPSCYAPLYHAQPGMLGCHASAPCFVLLVCYMHDASAPPIFPPHAGMFTRLYAAIQLRYPICMLSLDSVPVTVEPLCPVHPPSCLQPVIPQCCTACGGVLCVRSHIQSAHHCVYRFACPSRTHTYVHSLHAQMPVSIFPLSQYTVLSAVECWSYVHLSLCTEHAPCACTTCRTTGPTRYGS